MIRFVYLKNLLIIITLVLCILGMVVIYFSIVQTIISSNIVYFIELIFGEWLFWATIYGFYSAWNNYSVSIKKYGIHLLILLFFAAFSMIYHTTYYMIGDARLEIKKIIDDYYYDANVKNLCDEFQQKHKCCGSTGPDSYLATVTNLHTEPPGSCFPDNDRKQPIFKDGCSKAKATETTNQYLVHCFPFVICFVLQSVCAIVIFWTYPMYSNRWVQDFQRIHAPNRTSSSFY